MKLSDLTGNFRQAAEQQLGKSREQKPIKARRGKMNKTETAFADGVLASRLKNGEIASWYFEGIKLKIGNGAYFCPDFIVTMPDGRTEIYEIKGHRYAAGIVRLKTAAMLYPHWRFVLVMRGKNHRPWNYTDVS